MSASDLDVPAATPPNGLLGRRPGPVTAALADPGRRRCLVSFELFPPRSPSSAGALDQAVDRLTAAGPDFVSVTCGASGSSQEGGRDLVAHLQERSVHVLAHLAAGGRDEAGLRRVAEDVFTLGVRGVLALRGDPPGGDHAWRPPPGAVSTASEVVRLLRRTAAELELADGVDVAVAAYPAGHPQSTSRSQDLAALRAKQEAGADFAITQLFFDPADYTSLVASAREAGVDLPLLPGLLPLTDPVRLERMSALTGVRAPASLLAFLDGASGAERYRRGVAATADLARAVLDAGAPGLHLFSMNQADPALDVLAALDLVPAPTRPASGGPA